MISLTGIAALVLPPETQTCDPSAFLKNRKSRKFMGVQDDLAVVATGTALAQSGLATPLGERTGLYFAIGYIPFREEDIAPVLEASLTNGQFDIHRFGAGGWRRAHPLLTFRCLPNMPAYHVSVNFGIEGPYFVTYPSVGQWYAALDEARAALESGDIDIAVVGGIAAQSNFLVQHHFSRVDPPAHAADLRDAAGVIVLEREAYTRQRGGKVLASLESVSVTFAELEHTADDKLGPGAPTFALAANQRGRFRHESHARDGTHGESVWLWGER